MSDVTTNDTAKGDGPTDLDARASGLDTNTGIGWRESADIIGRTFMYVRFFG